MRHVVVLSDIHCALLSRRLSTGRSVTLLLILVHSRAPQISLCQVSEQPVVRSGWSGVCHAMFNLLLTSYKV